MFFVSGTDMRTSKMHRLKEIPIMKSISVSGVISEFFGTVSHSAFINILYFVADSDMCCDCKLAKLGSNDQLGPLGYVAWFFKRVP